MIARYALYTIAWFIAAIAGMLGGYFLARYTGIGYSIWGNGANGYCGDTLYKNKEAKHWLIRYFPCYNWSCIRNPANNLLRHTLNAEGVVTKIVVKGNLSIITLDFERDYFFYYKKDGYKMKFGHRFWDNEIKKGEYYNASFVFNP